MAGIGVGVAVALVQSVLSMRALRWSLRKPSFYAVWIGGIFARVAVLIATAVVVEKYTKLNLVATLLSLVVATTVFLIFETRILLTDKKNGFFARS